MKEHDIVLLPDHMERASYGEGIKGHRMPIVHQSYQIYSAGRLALAFAERWGLVVCEFDGEDRSGRQKLRRLTAEELAKESCAAAAAMWAEIEARDWFLEIPLPAERPKTAAEKMQEAEEKE